MYAQDGFSKDSSRKMPNILVKNTIHGFMVQSMLETALHDPRYADLILVCAENEPILAHKFILATLCPFIRMVLENQPPTSDAITIHLRDVKTRHIRMLLQCLYIGKLQFSAVDFNELSDLFELLGIRHNLVVLRETLMTNNCNVIDSLPLTHQPYLTQYQSGLLFKCTMCSACFDQRITLNVHLFVTHKVMDASIPKINMFIQSLEGRSQ